MTALASVRAQAEITQDTMATAGSSGGTPASLSWSHTVQAGGQVYLVVALSFRVDNNANGAGAATYTSGITANGTPMTCAVAIADNGTGSCGSGGTAGGSGEPYLRSEIWYLSLGSIGAQTTESVVATLHVANSANGSAIAATSITYFGVSGLKSGGDAYSNGGQFASTSASLAVTATQNQMVVSNLAIPRSSTSAASTPNASISDISGAADFDYTQDATSSASGSNPTMGWTWTGAAPYALTAAVLTAAPPARRGQVIMGSANQPCSEASAVEVARLDR